MSFSTGSLLLRESVMLATLYHDAGAWNSVRDRVITENLLQSRTLNTLKRVCREVISRLKTLNSGELEFLIECSPRDQTWLLWIAICRRYRFIADFAVEVLHERYITLKTDLNHEDYESFYNRKSQWHEELDSISPVTRRKLRQVLFKMLREAGLLTVDNMITSAMLSPELLNVISSDQQRDVLYFPVFDADLSRMG